jgi:hypothetical protein
VHWSWSQPETVVAIKCLDAHTDARAHGIAARVDTLTPMPIVDADAAAAAAAAASSSPSSAAAAGALKASGRAAPSAAAAAAAGAAAAAAAAAGGASVGYSADLAHRVPVLFSPRSADAAAADADPAAGVVPAPAARADVCLGAVHSVAGADARVWLHALRSARSAHARAAARAHAAVVDELLELRAEVARFRAGGGPSDRLERHALQQQGLTPAQLEAAAVARGDSGYSALFAVTLAAVAVGAYVLYSNNGSGSTGKSAAAALAAAAAADAAAVPTTSLLRPTVVNQFRLPTQAGGVVVGAGIGTGGRSRMLFKDYDYDE